jgi:hypothetical protein
VRIRSLGEKSGTFLIKMSSSFGKRVQKWWPQFLQNRI